MINVTNKNLNCIEENCNIRSTFNLPNTKSGIFCSEHKKENIPSRASSSKFTC